MAKWTVGGKQEGQGTLQGTFEYESGKATGESVWKVYQDETPFLEQAKRDRDTFDKSKEKGYRKFATIPDIVAIEILQKYGINIHDPNTINDPSEMNRFKNIIKKEYKYLLSF
jgi:hypothetical protein